MEENTSNSGHAAVILAGGASKRMGVDKASVLFDGITLIDRTVRAARRLFPVVVVSVSNASRGNEVEKLLSNSDDVRFVADEFPGRGPIGGIHAAMKNIDAQYYFFTACDMPFNDCSLGAHMGRIAQGQGFDVVYPVMNNGHFHPLHAVYSSGCLPHIQDQLEAGLSNRIISFFEHVKVREFSEKEVRELDPECLQLMNINTPDDLEKAIAILKKKSV